MSAEFREQLEDAILSSGHTLKSLSIALGRNHAYLQQFVKRGTPRALPEDVREQLADILGGTPDDYRSTAKLPATGKTKTTPRVSPFAPAADDILTVPVYDLAASAGTGSIVTDESPVGYHPFNADDLRSLTRTASDRLAIIEVAGDSMEPTLRPRDRVLIDRSADRLRGDGIYVILVDDSLLIKRISADLASGQIILQSDNERYALQRVDNSLINDGRLSIIGQVIWVSRAIV